MSLPFDGSITAAGVANAVVNNLSTPDSLALVEVSGAYTGAQLVFEALPIGGTVWFPVGGVQQDTQGVVNGTAAAPYVAVDGSTFGIKFDVTGCVAIRVWASALTKGPVVLHETSGSFFFSPPTAGGFAAGTVNLAILWQLAHLSALIAALDEKAAAVYVTPNPVLPVGLLPTIWDVAF